MHGLSWRDANLIIPNTKLLMRETCVTIMLVADLNEISFHLVGLHDMIRFGTVSRVSDEDHVRTSSDDDWTCKSQATEVFGRSIFVA